MIPDWVFVVLALVCFGLAAAGKKPVLGEPPAALWRILMSNGKTDGFPDAAWRGIYVVVGLGLLAAAVL